MWRKLSSLALVTLFGMISGETQAKLISRLICVSFASLPSMQKGINVAQKYNFTIAIDVSTWISANYRAPYVSRLAQIMQLDIIEIDSGEPGLIETTSVQSGIPANTFELSGPTGGIRLWLFNLRVYCTTLWF